MLSDYRTLAVLLLENLESAPMLFAGSEQQIAAIGLDEVTLLVYLRILVAKSCCRHLKRGVDSKRLCSLTRRSCIEMPLPNPRTLGRNTGNPRVSQSSMVFNLNNIQRAAGESLGKFIQMAWHTIEPHQPYLHNWHISAVCEHLEAVSRRQIKRLIINIPPRSMKSIAVSVMWPAWTWTQKPSERFLFASYSAKLSTKHSVDRRTVISSDWYQRLWKDRFQLSSDQNEKSPFSNNCRGTMAGTTASVEPRPPARTRFVAAGTNLRLSTVLIRGLAILVHSSSS